MGGTMAVEQHGPPSLPACLTVEASLCSELADRERCRPMSSWCASVYEPVPPRTQTNQHNHDAAAQRQARPSPPPLGAATAPDRDSAPPWPACLSVCLCACCLTYLPTFLASDHAEAEEGPQVPHHGRQAQAPVQHLERLLLHTHPHHREPLSALPWPCMPAGGWVGGWAAAVPACLRD